MNEPYEEAVNTRFARDVVIDEPASPILSGVIVVLILLILVLAVLIVRSVFFVSPAPRTVAERDILAAEQAVRAEPANAIRHVDLGIAYFQAGMNERALSEFDTALQYDKNSFDAHFQMGRVHQSQKDFKLAIQEFEKAVKINKTLSSAYFQLGMIYLEEKRDYKKAAEEFQAALKSGPMLSDVHYYLGFSYEKLGQKEGALKEYREAIKFIPDFKAAREGVERLTDPTAAKSAPAKPPAVLP